MSKVKALLKSLTIYWLVRQHHARRKYKEAIALIAAQMQASSSNTSDYPTIMIFSSVGIFADHLTVDTLLAHALEHQGARVIIALCDGQMQACHVSDRYAYAFAPTEAARAQRQSSICRACTGATIDLLRESGLTYAYFSQGRAHTRESKLATRTDDIEDEINSGIIRFAASSHPSVLSQLPPDVTLRYTEGGAAASESIDGLIDLYRPDIVIAHHGIYVPQGIVQKAAKQRGLTFYSWHFGYRKSTLIFSRGDTYHRELTGPLPAAFEAPLTEGDRGRITEYLSSRVSGGQDWIHFNRKPQAFEVKSAKRGYFVCYTSVDWDAALHFPASVFNSQFDFLEKLVTLFEKTPDFDLVIRIHPAEVTGFHPAALSAENFLRSRPVPANVRIISAIDTTSSYDLARHCIASIIYNTKLGIELPPMGIPVIVAGDSWIRGKGFSYDVESPGDLAAFVHQGEALQVSTEQRERALQFAHYFYYRRCIDTPELSSAGPKFQISVSPEGLRLVSEKGGGISRIAEFLMAGRDVELPARQAV
jgi:hypothetical protein